jgi:hypothetical protein
MPIKYSDKVSGTVLNSTVVNFWNVSASLYSLCNKNNNRDGLSGEFATFMKK